MATLTIKLSEEQQAKYGVQTSDGVFELIDANLETKSKLKESESQRQGIQSRIDAIETRLKAVEERKPEVDTEALLSKILPKVQETAKTEASRETVAIISKIGGTAVTVSGAGVDVTETANGKSATKDFSAIVKQKVADGMTKVDAIKWSIANHPKEYTEARSKGIKL